ncbi:MAG TPA: hypothetical protein VKK79_04690 [Candidatus Lokiarchaeia archaeon]|nr:hypothetical protein [Candidatus Lokiarchaeia archaeon]
MTNGNHQCVILENLHIDPPVDPEIVPLEDRETVPLEDHEIAPMEGRAVDPEDDLEIGQETIGVAVPRGSTMRC